MDKKFNPNRLRIARLRRKLTYKELAERVSMSSKMLSLYEKEDNGHIPTSESLSLIARILGYPQSFFFGEDIENIDASTVSFRSLKSMKAAQQHAAICAGQLGVLVSEYMHGKFSLPAPCLPDLRGYDPGAAAETIRDSWGLGTKSIKNMIHLLESKGIRVFSLAENTADVDAFSFWKDGVPYIFLNTQKSAERSRFDAAHELGHLLLHKHGSPTGRDLEYEADNFASSFLVTESSLIALAPNFITLDSLIILKKNWAVSVVSLIVRLKQVELLTEWQYRTLMIEASQRGYRTNEPDSCVREKSLIFEKVLPMLKAEGIGLNELSAELSLPLEELCNLIFMPAVVSSNSTSAFTGKSRANLKVVS